MKRSQAAKSTLLYKEEAYKIVGAAMEVYNQLGTGFLEAVYQEAFALEMEARSIPFHEQPVVPIMYKNHQLKHVYRPDYVAYDKIIVEIKAITFTSGPDEAQLIHYLRATGMRLGLLINFGCRDKLQWLRRIV